MPASFALTFIYVRRVQIAELQDEAPDVTVPYLLTVPGTSRRLSSHRLVALTGKRFVNVTALRHLAKQTAVNACNSTDHEAGATAADARCAKHASSQKRGADAERLWQEAHAKRTCTAGTAVATADPDGTASAANGACTTQDGIDTNSAAQLAAAVTLVAEQDHSVRGLDLVLHCIGGDAPDRLSIADVLDIVRAARFCLADEVLRHLGLYIKPLLLEVPLHQVRTNASLSESEDEV